MSTDMAINLSKRFIRSISQPFDHSQTGISLWTLEDIEAKQQRDKEEEERRGGFVDETSGPNGASHADIDDAMMSAEGINGLDGGMNGEDVAMRDTANGRAEVDADLEEGYDRAAMEEQAALEAAMNEPMSDDEL